MKAYSSEEEIIQNLKDAGCSKKQIKELMRIIQQWKKRNSM